MSMKMTTARAAVRVERRPLRIESAPSDGPTVRSSSTLTGAGSAPARSTMARSVASSVVNPPVIWARPDGIRSRITGAECTLPSRTMASRLPTFASVRSEKALAPAELNSTDTYGSLVFWSMDTRELDQDAVVALLLNRGLRHPELVHAVADRLQPLAHREVPERGDLLRPERQHHAARRLIGLLDLEPPRLAEHALRVVPGLGRRELDHEVGGAAPLDAARADPLLLQLATDRVALPLRLGLERLVHVHAEHEVNATLQVQPQVDRLLRRVEVPDGAHDDGHDDPDAERQMLAHQLPASLLAGAVTIRPREARSKSSFTESATLRVTVCSLSPTTVPCRPLVVTTRSPFLTEAIMASRSFFCFCWGRIRRK